MSRSSRPVKDMPVCSFFIKIAAFLILEYQKGGDMSNTL